MLAQEVSQPPISKTRASLFSAMLVIISVGLALLAAEVTLRLKNSSMTNYDIEMWRYAKELKTSSPDPALDFDHLHSRSAILQNVEIRLNNEGLRGGAIRPLEPGGRRILLLGGSITLGWGVAEDETLAAQLEKRLSAAGEKVQVLNGGVGNYNAERYVSRFFKELTDVQPTDIVVHYFLRDAEALPPGGGNWFLRHSELAVTLWIAFHRLFDRHGEQSLVAHYRAVYEPDAQGFSVMRQKLARLADYARQHSIRIYLAMVPDVHNLIDYKFAFVHKIMKEVAERDGYKYIDLLPALQGRPPQELWAMPGDPHPNALGHRLMAEAIYKTVLLLDTSTPSGGHAGK
jgi:lysophospholipase L1-like esterase